MDPAWIGLAGGVIGTMSSAVIAVRQTRASEHLARLNSDLETERHERIALLDRDLRAEDVLARYREPLAAAAFDLQSRCYNILRLNFLEKFGEGHERFSQRRQRRCFGLRSTSAGRRSCVATSSF